MIQKKYFIFQVVLWVGSLAGLSYCSDYDITKSVHDMSIEIALMLTPYGIFHNFIIDKESFLRPYYFTVSKSNQSLFAEPIILFSFILFVAISLFFLYLIRKKNT